MMIRLVTLAGIFFAIFCRSTSAQEKPPEGVKFEIISIRALSDKEIAFKAPDQIGINIAIRLRLSAEQGIEYLAYEGSSTPLGYSIRILKDHNVWLYGYGMAQSPGIEKQLQFGKWIILSDHGAIEWEQLDSTYDSGEKRAFTIFIKEKNNKIHEIISDTCIVPSKKELAIVRENKDGVGQK
jgi:hypothetical protein